MGRPHHKTRAHADRKGPQPEPVEDPQARKLLEALLQDAKIERMTQAEILEELKRKHQGDIPARVCWQFIGDRREATRAGGAICTV